LNDADEITAIDGAPVTGEAPCMTRGLNPLGALAWVREEHGNEGVRRVLAALSATDRALLRDGAVPAREWIPFLTHARLLEAIDAAYGNNDLALLRTVGSAMVRRDFPVVGKPFLRVIGPGFFLDKLMALWRVYHSRGRWEITRGPGEVRGVLVDHPQHHRACCAMVLGWAEGVIELSGARDAHAEELRCAARGAPCCTFEMTWLEWGARRSPRERTPRPPT
jgi:hypothetical protein